MNFLYAFTRVRIILMNGIELEALRFQHSCARMNQALRVPLAQNRRLRLNDSHAFQLTHGREA